MINQTIMFHDVTSVKVREINRQADPHTYVRDIEITIREKHETGKTLVRVTLFADSKEALGLEEVK